MRVINYNEFFRNFVLRRRNDLLNPKFINLSEISLPRNSLIHYSVLNATDIGPSNTEALISTYPDQVFIEFADEFEPVLDTGKMIHHESKKEIKSYRGRHYNYNWTKDIKTVYNKEKVLIVKSYGLVNKYWQSRPLMFSKFTNYFDKQLMLIKGINEEASRGNRNQFVRLDLPTVMPSFNKLLVDYDNYVKSFKGGLPVPSNKMFNLTKAEGSYWLLDLIAFLTGDYDYCTFNELTEEAEDSLHLIFNFNGNSLVINFGLFKGWLDDLLDDKALKEIQAEKTKNYEENLKLVERGRKPVELEPGSNRTKHLKRFNVTKRFFLSLLNLVKDGLAERELNREEDLDNGEREISHKEKDRSRLKEKEEVGEEKEEDGYEDESSDVVADTRTLADVLTDDPGTDDKSPKGRSAETDSSSDQTVEVSDLSSEEEDSDQDWTSDVDDSLLEEETYSDLSSRSSVDKDPFKSPDSGVKLALERRAKEGNLSVAENKFFEKKANRYKEIKLPNGQTIEDFIKIDDKELESLKDDALIDADLITVTDESMLQSRANVLRKNYVTKFLEKDIISMFLGIQNSGTCLNDLKVEELTGVEGKYNVYSIQLHPVDGEQNTHHIRIPKVDDDGMFVIDGVKSHLQQQRMERPIRKIDKDRVVLTSYYPNQLMLTRSRKVADNLSSWTIKQLVARSKEDKNIKFSRGSNFNAKLKAPRVYSMLSTTFKWIKIGKLTLDFNFAELIKQYPEFKKFDKTENFLIGVSGKDEDVKPITINSFGTIEVGGEFYGEFNELLGIDTSKAPIENVVVNISGYLYPIGVILCYYFGIDELIKLTKLITRSVPMGNRLQLSNDEFALTFNDEYLIFNRNQKLAGLVFGGMRKLNNIGNYSRSDLNDKSIWVPLIGDGKSKPQHFQEMENLYDLFIDPITKGELRKLGYSQSFHYLLIDAVKLLEIDKTEHEVEINEQRIVGYERFAGHGYRELCKSIRGFRNKGRGRKHKIDLNPEAVITNIITDTSVNLVEEVNPVHEVKNQEEMTFGGTGGRSDISVVKRARVQLDSYHGIVSEANKDSGKIGFVTYTTSDPRVADYRGNIAVDEKSTIAGMSSITGNLAFGISKDD